ncbi:hypothetical protein TRFO_21400 [Tritrichomonas foetus]|uniref:Uncharacterized protein n=1 Tax=Tritrichomonas foetus TaxID=1144522 RepID=A0A1J4KK04_9EUKA|nr:hypothetical protein TRFO_21400 [Tritrichomonas foetus]|eukprot:OHT09677.1 hypothetical protein TRFO_21400 [Tritrichomonas foetus]
MGNQTSSSLALQSHIKNTKNQDLFILSMSGTNPKFSDSLTNSSVVLSQAAPLNYFCFFTKGPIRILRYWQLRNYFVCSMQVSNPPIKQNYAIVHTYQDVQFLSVYLDQIAFSNMVYFMDSVPSKLTRGEYINRMISLSKNQDTILTNKIYPIYRIKVPQPTLEIALPTLYGRPARPFRPEDEFSSLTSLPSNALNSDLYQTRDITLNGRQRTSKAAPELADRRFDDSTTNAGESSFLNPISEPSSIRNDSNLSTSSNMRRKKYDSDFSISSSFAKPISEPGPSDSQISEVFKDARRAKVHLHNHHNLHQDSNTSVSITDSFFSAATSASGSSAITNKRKKRVAHSKSGAKDDSSRISRSSRSSRISKSSRIGSSSSASSSRRKVRGKSGESESSRKSKKSTSSKNSTSSVNRPKIHLFGDFDDDLRRSKKKNSSDAPSFFSEAIISSTTGNPSKKKRNVGLDVDLRHDVGFTTSESQH